MSPLQKAIRLRAEIRRTYNRTKKRATHMYKRSFTDEDSDSYDRAHELDGELTGLAFGHAIACEMVEFLRKERAR